MNAISPLDFSLVRQPTPLGAERPAGNDQRTELHEAAQAFEAVLLRQMLSSARATDFGGEDLFEGSDDTFTEMRDEQFADIASKSGQLGFAASIERQLARFLPQGETPGGQN
ncbi:MAG: flagellar biosynthesis protein FlgJ [Citromicrobium sp.]|nr:flagellar biosynthesis protein FlgJ [Citromicrobium sp.]MAO95066.1 flagellar biosynthesis protein FlgJ [Citromicrobium sp.]MAS85813.1 flagellar biosynthesis protein FlgJ [Erythrobacteraceae bacterium]MBD76802.1 flagellar biosynthesis protein FlgJ [Citromicrobium sp.]MBT47430.1 flagellar biosynthesis protein FlgJ [Citromicrobium sp.]|tara:strand:+ start:232 stop:567 length:336 start_codon:yes stop_codon:yes gene_type:complete